MFRVLKLVRLGYTGHEFATSTVLASQTSYPCIDGMGLFTCNYRKRHEAESEHSNSVASQNTSMPEVLKAHS